MSILLRKKSQKLAVIESATKEAFTKVKEELDEHLDAINHNTTENKDTHNRIRSLESKVDKLSEKFDQILATLGEKKTYSVSELTLREQEVFIALYTTQEYEPCTVRAISYKTGLPLAMIESLLTILLEKGVPLIKKITDNEVSYTVEQEFKELQTKSNILNLNKDMIRHIASVNV